MLTLSNWPYLLPIALSGNLKTDVVGWLTVNDKPKIAAHCISVAKTSEEIAARFDLDISTAFAGALLHDCSGVVKPQDMLDYAIAQNWSLDDAERKHPFLLHQRLSVVFAQDFFKISNAAILSAIGCHSTLKANPSPYDMVLFLADKLSWDQEGRPPFYDLVSSALEHSLAYASLTYINFVLNNGMILSAHQWLIDAKNHLESIC